MQEFPIFLLEDSDSGDASRRATPERSVDGMAATCDPLYVPPTSNQRGQPKKYRNYFAILKWKMLDMGGGCGRRRERRMILAV